MVVHRLKSKSERLDEWHVAKKIKPSQRGAIKLARSYGPELLCVRYRENPEGTERLTTVEILVDRVIIQKRDDPVVSFKLRQGEIDSTSSHGPRRSIQRSNLHVATAPQRGDPNGLEIQDCGHGSRTLAGTSSSLTEPVPTGGNFIMLAKTR